MDTATLQKLKLRPTGARLEIEPLSDTGNAIPIGVRLQAPVGLTIESFEVFAPDNPVPQVIKIKLSTPQSSYSFDTRIRLGIGQDVWVVAKLSDGSLLGHFAPTVLTSSACFDAS
ncbi:MAG: thiosulfate oxidation carrier protein SoxY [Burkholderiaceae bacterium]